MFRSIPALAILLLLAAAPGVTAQQASGPELTALKALQSTVVALDARITPATVALKLRGQEGSGVIVSEDGLVLTAAHVFDRPGQSVGVVLHDGRTLRGTTLGRESYGDFGMVRILDEGPWPFCELGSSEELERGELVVATGHPGGFQEGRRPPLRLGRVLSGPNRRMPFLRTSCVINSGDSGGPLFDLEGRVVGIHSRIQAGETRNYHVPIDDVAASWQRLLDSDSWDARRQARSGGPELGIHAVSRDGTSGCTVTEVVEGGPADRAGLKVGDVVEELDGRRMADVDRLARSIRRRSVGDEVTLGVLRGEERLEIRVELGERSRGGEDR